MQQVLFGGPHNLGGALACGCDAFAHYECFPRCRLAIRNDASHAVYAIDAEAQRVVLGLILAHQFAHDLGDRWQYLGMLGDESRIGGASQ